MTDTIFNAFKTGKRPLGFVPKDLNPDISLDTFKENLQKYIKEYELVLLTGILEATADRVRPETLQTMIDLQPSLVSDTFGILFANSFNLEALLVLKHNNWKVTQETADNFVSCLEDAKEPEESIDPRYFPVINFFKQEGLVI